MAGAAYVDATTWPVRQGSRSRYLSGDGGQPRGNLSAVECNRECDS